MHHQHGLLVHLRTGQCNGDTLAHGAMPNLLQHEVVPHQLGLWSLC